MLYPTAQSWNDAANKRVALFGMSGMGKTTISDLLRSSGHWFHYSVDYRIGTRYMGEHIVDNFKREAMKVPFLRELLLRDSIYIASNLSFENLAPLSTYLGKPGDPARGGIPFAEYRRRQAEHHDAEVAALKDTRLFIDKARAIYRYPHFICDTGGSICEVAEADNPQDPVMSALSEAVLMVWIKGTEDTTEELVRRFDKDPKPMYYRPKELEANRVAYLSETGLSEDKVDPDDFIRWSFRRLMAARQSRYAQMSKWGITVSAAEIADVGCEQDFINLIAAKLP